MTKLRQELSKVKASKAQDNLTPEDFSHFDSLHYCGNDSIKSFFESSNITSSSKVLDLCAGIGSTSRFIASRFNCELIAVDYLSAFTILHQEINNLCGMQNIRVLQGDVTQLDLGSLGLEGQHQVVYSILSFLYIPNKSTLFEVCNKALSSGGQLYIEDYVMDNSIPMTEEEKDLVDRFKFISRLQRNEYVQLLEEAGFRVDEYISRTGLWSRFVFERAEGFLKEKETILKEFGTEVWETRYLTAIHIPCRLFHQLEMSLDEARNKYPLTCIELGDLEFQRWIMEIPQKCGGANIRATKIRSL